MTATTTSVIDVSTVIIQKLPAQVSNLKLQKLLYYVQGWSLAARDTPAFDQRIEAWAHGPVVPVAFHEYKAFRWNPIVAPAEPVVLALPEMQHIDEVLKTYGKFAARDLEAFTHEEAPWIEARGGLPSGAVSHAEITHNSMRRYFKARMNA